MPKEYFFPMNFYKMSHLLELVQIPMFQKNFKFSFITFFLQVVKSTLVEEENLEVIRGNFIWDGLLGKTDLLHFK